MSNRFRDLCDELTRTLTPALRSAGYTCPNEKFSRDTVKYEFRRPSTAGTQTIAVLFNRGRSPEFSVQLYLEPLEGLETLEARGGELVLGTLSPARARWPFGVRAFGGASLPSRLLRQSPASAAQAVQSALALLPEIEAWWGDQRNSKHIVAGTITYRPRR